MTPRSEALAFRIWAYANPRGWDCSVKDIAEALGETWQRVGKVLQLKGWHHRIRHDTAAAEPMSRYPGTFGLRLFDERGVADEILQRLRREAGL